MKESDTGGVPDQLGQPDKPKAAQERPLSLSQPRGGGPSQTVMTQQLKVSGFSFSLDAPQMKGQHCQSEKSTFQLHIFILTISLNI